MKTEANMILGNIATLQQAYNLENSRYATYGSGTAWYGRLPSAAVPGNACGTAAVQAVQDANNDLGFTIEPCVSGKAPRYAYNIYAVGAVLPLVQLHTQVVLQTT